MRSVNLETSGSAIRVICVSLVEGAGTEFNKLLKLMPNTPHLLCFASLSIKQKVLRARHGLVKRYVNQFRTQ